MNDFVIGAIAGSISRTLTAPLELYKIQRQNYFLPNATLCNVIHKEGIQCLWKGNGTNCIRIAPQTAINFATYQIVKPYINHFTTSTPIQHLLSGGISGATAMTITYPLETIRSRLSLQTYKSQYTGIIDALYKIKVSNLYGGLCMSIIGFAPYNAFNFMFFNLFKTYTNKTYLNETIHKLICGGFAGCFAVTITYPSDLIRRRLQLQGFHYYVPKYNGIIDCGIKIVKKDGFAGLYKGLLPAYLKLFPTMAIQFWILDYLKKNNK